MSIPDKIRQYGVAGTARRAVAMAASKSRHQYYRWTARNAPQYANPTPPELAQIEHDLSALSIPVLDYAPAEAEFRAFQQRRYFPPDYHGGVNGGVWDEKLAEHWITAELLQLSQFERDDVYVDVAASSSPWVKTVRDRLGICAFAVDLEVGPSFSDLPFYRVENATATSFADGSVRGASLHCAYEMFRGNDDILLMDEMARILRPGGKAVIVPLYMHTHYCAYCTPEYYGKGYSDPAAKEYVRSDCSGVPSSRKYDAGTLANRVLSRVHALGMTYRLLALRNKEQLGTNVYCHFILEVTR